jgi:glycosyltransferase involved in cell wall biosynthesis
METLPAPEKPVVVLVGNYALDRQESMLRFRDLLQARLESLGFPTETISPRAWFGRILHRGVLGKWLAYLDKYILFPPVFALRLSGIKRKFPDRKVVVHICDHANSVYASLARKWFPVLVTCHDLLAVRGARGEETYCPASGFGRILQAAILRGMGHADFVACISRATHSDLIRLAPALTGCSQFVPLTLNYPYHAVSREEALGGLARAGIDLPFHGFVLHVGAGHPRKNRESWPGKIVFAGEPLSSAERALAKSVGLEDRVMEIPRPDNETLLALYNTALALVFMSYAEGFGWPILEAQASGCPVICSNRTSVPEVAGEGARVHEPEDYAAIAGDIRRLQEPAFRDALIALGFENARKYSDERMMGAYEEIYRRI